MSATILHNDFIGFTTIHPKIPRLWQSIVRNAGILAVMLCFLAYKNPM